MASPSEGGPKLRLGARGEVKPPEPGLVRQSVQDGDLSWRHSREHRGVGVHDDQNWAGRCGRTTHTSCLGQWGGVDTGTVVSPLVWGLPTSNDVEGCLGGSVG